ncbi:MAG TPA: cobaltochelatase subunit CobN [Pyrinomonadaceae bacterium]|nr:cobaltochelatase subunit CobN [Pyrinomonadaceae bacterium]
MNVTVLYVGSSLLAPLKQAEAEIERRYALGLRVAAHNFGAPLDEETWARVEQDLGGAEVVFVIHVTDGENAARLVKLLDRHEARLGAVVVINCMADLMRRTRMGRLRFGGTRPHDDATAEGDDAETRGDAGKGGRARGLLRSVAGWMGQHARGRSRHTQYLRFAERLPALLRLVPNAGRLRDAKHYLQLFCYFLQPTPANVRSMLLYALRHYAPDPRVRAAKLDTPPPESLPAVGIYHPEAKEIFQTFEAYRAWHAKRARKSRAPALEPRQTVGLLLMRPQIVSGARAHYDALIRAVEAEGLAVLPAISTFMDNREACAQFFVEGGETAKGKSKKAKGKRDGDNGSASGERASSEGESAKLRARVSQVVSLTGFSFVGGPAMNDSEAAVEFLRELDCPFRSVVSLDVQTVEAWRESWTGLNPVQAGMQVAIPEIDGATEPFVYGGMSDAEPAPVALDERCRRIARRLARWNRLQTAPRAELKLALVLFCFPPNKGNTGTAAELDVFPSVWEMLRRLKGEGYAVEVPPDADALRDALLGGNSEKFGAGANVLHRMSVGDYRRLCPHVEEIEREWGRAPGNINSFGGELLIQGVRLGNAVLCVQPTFGYEGDPTRLLMARSGAPHHGFAALYTYIEKVFGADAVLHVGTHGALEFMPGKQVGLSDACWPDRLIGELPHVYAYSVNNPSEGSIARRRSYAELISYLTPPVADAGVYKDLASLKELLVAYRQTEDEAERRHLFALIEERAAALHLNEENVVAPAAV